MTGIEHVHDSLVSGSLTSHDDSAPSISDADAGVAELSVSDADDRELLRRVRAGEDAAFAELFSRHAVLARGYALRYATDAAEADDIAAEAFFRVLQAVRRGAGPDDNVRGYLLTVVRRLAAEWRTRRRDVPVADEELSRRVDPDADQAGTRAEAHLIARAFTSLPQRWRRVLWQVEVEGERPAVVAPHFGLSPNATAALARRAREGLRAAYLQAHVPPSTASSACQGVVGKLGAYTAGLVRGSEAQRIVGHLSACSSCRAVHAELADVCAGLRRYAGSVPGLMPAAAFGHGVRGLGTKSMALAGKAAAFGVRFKLAVATMSMVAVGGLGVSAGPLLMHFTTQINADRGTVAQLPVLPDGVSTNSAGAPRHPFGPGLESTGTDIMGPRARQQAQHGAAPPNSTDSSSTQNTPRGQSGQSSSTDASTHTGQSVQELTTTSNTPDNNPAMSPAGTRNAKTVTPTTDPTTTDPTAAANPQETVWSTEYTSNGTTVWITRWTEVWQATQGPAGR
ncbi:MAG TPA: sigma-70 family RNA polymerase sigma factor [Pseudonocardiaceae bacterium]|nr:sigma-70 family RNA polymerase sigma factor [Pseudonocardiaceae bacterium]